MLAALGGERSLRVEGVVSDEVGADEESMMSAGPTMRETLAEYARSVPNHGYGYGNMPSDSGSFELSLAAEAREYRALLESFSPGVRASFEGALAAQHVVMAEEAERRKAERERAEAQRERDEAEYAVFIEEHLRRVYGRNEVSDE